jgi:hypothetical protein
MDDISDSRGDAYSLLPDVLQLDYDQAGDSREEWDRRSQAAERPDEAFFSKYHHPISYCNISQYLIDLLSNLCDKSVRVVWSTILEKAGHDPASLQRHQWRMMKNKDSKPQQKIILKSSDKILGESRPKKKEEKKMTRLDYVRCFQSSVHDA